MAGEEAVTGRDSEVRTLKSEEVAQVPGHASSAPGRVGDQSNPPDEDVTERDFRGSVRRVGAWARETFQPPDFWSEARPPLRSTWLYARYGDQAPPTGLTRRWAIVEGWITFAGRLVLAVADWIWSRPARRYAALFLWFLLDMAGWLPGPF